MPAVKYHFGRVSFFDSQFCAFSENGDFKGKQNLVCVQNQQVTQTQTVTVTKTNKRLIRRAEKQLHASLGNNRRVPC